MEIQLSDDQKAFANGRLLREEDVMHEALDLWESRERTRSEILAAIDEAEESAAGGAGRVITQESMRELAAEVNARGRARLAAKTV